MLLFIDDLKPMTRDYGHPHMHTPNFDRLALSGMRFENAYCQVPTCGASRASLMTSLYPTVERFPNFLTWAEQDAVDHPTLPQKFREAGYHTISNGKVFHHRNDTDERSWSEPAWRPETKGTTFYNDETAAFMKTVTETRGFAGASFRKKKVPMFEKGKIDPMKTNDGLIAAKTIQDMQRLHNDNKPFFIACGFAKPHMPFYSPEKTYQPYPLENIALAEWRKRPSPNPASLREVKEQFSYLPMTHDFSRRLDYNSDDYHRYMRQGYYASVTHADDLTGRIFDEMESLGLDKNTVVVVLGDHGWLLGEHNEWAKNQLFHEALRTAMWMRGPGVKENSVAETFVEFVDIYPTLCEVAGIKLDDQTVHGKSLVPLLKDPSLTHRDYAYTRFENGDAISGKDYYMASWSRQKKPEALLIDRKADPPGKTNLADREDHSDIRKKLQNLINQKIATAEGALPVVKVAKRPLEIKATIDSKKPIGVILSHGGLRFGYALTVVKGKPVFAVRNNKELVQIQGKDPIKGRVELSATLSAESVKLYVNGKPAAEAKSPGLLEQEPVGPFVHGEDRGDQVGKYPKKGFNGRITSHSVSELKL
ncbi:MAG: sulfatase [Verrucomicrobiales bacterium]|nr:sulfatase [Verrucomicrobiales bacterium]